MTPYILPGMVIKKIDPVSIPALCQVDFSKLKSRKTEIVTRRQVAIALMAVFTDYDYGRITTPFRKDRATVYNCILRMDNALLTGEAMVLSILVPIFIDLYWSHQMVKESTSTTSKDYDAIECVDERLSKHIFSKSLVAGIQSGKYTSQASYGATG